MRQAAALLLLLLGPAPARAGLANQLYWPVANANATVCAYMDHAGKDWRCGGNRYSGHRGTDISVGSGNAVLAAKGGTVVERVDGCPLGYLGSTCGGGAGNHVNLSHGSDTTIYMHLLAGSGIAGQGAAVACGARLGASGGSGNSTGPHLHFEPRVGSGGSAWGGTSDDPFAGACGGPTSYWVDQGGGYVSSCGATSPSPRSATHCGCPAGTFALFNCNDAKTARVRCVDGQVQTEACAFGCEVKPLGVDDVCLPPPPCPDGLDATWRCSADGAARRRCEVGNVQTEACAHGCEAGACRERPPCPDGLGAAWTCSADGASRARCVDGTVTREACLRGCLAPADAEAACAAPVEALPGGCPAGTFAAWTCSLDALRVERCADGLLERRACPAGCASEGPSGQDACAPAAPGQGLSPAEGGCSAAGGGPLALALAAWALRRRRGAASHCVRGQRRCSAASLQPQSR